jgi:hypothetical protein
MKRPKSCSGASCASRLRPHCSEAATITPSQCAWRFSSALARQAHHLRAPPAADRRHAQLDRLFDDPVHLRALGQALRQGDGVGQFDIDRLDALPLLRAGALLADRRAGWRAYWPPSPLNSVSSSPGCMAHDVQVVGDRFRQVDDGAGASGWGQ